MSPEKRIAAYTLQRNYGRITPRQWRRISKARAKAGLPATPVIIVPVRPTV